MAAELHIHDGNWQQFVDEVVVDGERKARGLIPRDYHMHPVGLYGAGRRVDFPLIPRAEWSERIRDMEATQSRLSDVRNRGMAGKPIPSRDQNGRGYCWFHSGTSASLLLRAVAGLPYADLSAYAGACIIKNYRDEGGWGAQGVDWICENGVPTSEFWPQRAVDRKYDTPAMRANAKLHRITEGWWDLDAAQYDRNLTFDQVITCLLLRIPVVLDFDWWSHSVCGADPVDGVAQWGKSRAESGKLLTLAEFELFWGVDTGASGFGERIWNSWGDSWSDNGMGVVSGNKAIPVGAVAPRVSLPSAA